MLERQDYVKATSKLRKAVAKAATMLQEKMEELDTSSMQLEDGTRISWSAIKSNVGRETILFIDDGGDLTFGRSGGATETEEYLHGDYTCIITYAKSEDYVVFANSWQEIKKLIKKIENEKVEEIEDALKQDLTF